MKSYAKKLLHQKDIQFTVSRVHEKHRRKAQSILDHIFGSKKMLDVDETLVSRVDTKRRFSRCDGGRAKIIPCYPIVVKFEMSNLQKDKIV